MLVVFGGLPGSGKTTLARAVAEQLNATFVRIDSIEVALQRLGLPVGAAAYAAGNAVARDQLVLGRPVVVDAVNPIAAARQGWVDLASSVGIPCRFVEIVLFDAREHRRRVERRVADLEGHVLPTWEQVVALAYEPWTEERLVVESVGEVAVLVERILGWVGS